MGLSSRKIRIHQLALLEVSFVSPCREKGLLTAVKFVSAVAVLFRVELIVFFGVVFRCCAVLESEVLSTKRSMAAGSLGALGAMKPYERGADKQWVFPAERFAVAGGHDLDVNLPWGLI